MDKKKALAITLISGVTAVAVAVAVEYQRIKKQKEEEAKEALPTDDSDASEEAVEE